MKTVKTKKTAKTEKTAAAEKTVIADNTEQTGRPEKKTRVTDYLKNETLLLAVISVSGIFYNIGMTAGPWFEGKLAQVLADILGGTKELSDMLRLACIYVLVILAVQLMRAVKRLYVRKFANNLNRQMKEDLYNNLLQQSQESLEQEGVGSLMTKAASDVDACVEGIRKFTTEVFDTGVVMIAYLAMLLHYDVRLTLLSMIFPPAAYLIANRLKKIVARTAASYKESTGALNAATLDRVGNGITYRIYGLESERNSLYEKSLDDYEQKAVLAGIWENVMQPVYLVISMAGSLCILWFGGKNVLGTGWASWDIAAFVTYLSCFTKLASKSSKAAKLFNSVQKASVSWKRIQPLLSSEQKEPEVFKSSPETDTASDAHDSEQVSASKPSADPILTVQNVSFHYPDASDLFRQVCFCGHPGEIIGLTGPVACGKSTLGKLFLGELSYRGSIKTGGSVSYMGHEPELISGTIEENILLGDPGDAWESLARVQMDREVREMPDGIHTRIGNGGAALSGGQQARIALARTLFHRSEILILDDPFSAVDRDTERKLFEELRFLCGQGFVLLISHRLSLFPELDQVLWMENGAVTVSDHDTLMKTNTEYHSMYLAQTESEIKEV